jgi:hypothetical protein
VTLGDALGPVLGDELGESLGVALGPALGEALGAALGAELGPSLGPALGAALGPALGAALLFVVCDSDAEFLQNRVVSQMIRQLLGVIATLAVSVTSGYARFRPEGR